MEIGAFDVYNGLFTVRPWNSGETYKVSHHFDSGRIPVANFADLHGLPYNVNGISPCNKLLDTVWGVQANMATQVNRYPILPPKVAFMRFTPYYTATGLANRRAQFKVTYSTTMKFYFSPDSGINMFQMGMQGVLLSYPFKDPYDNAKASINRLNWGVHAEDFVIPMTGYVTEEKNRRETTQNDAGVQTETDENNLPTKEDVDTFQKANQRTHTQQGYKVTGPKWEDGAQPVTKVETDAREPAEDQPPAELSAAVMSDKGFTQAHIEKSFQAIKHTPKPTDIPYEVDKNKELIVDTERRNAPILPVKTYADGEK